MKKLMWGFLSLFVLSGFVAMAALSPNHFIDTLPSQQAPGSFPVANGYDWGISTSTNSVAPALPSYTAAQTLVLTPATTGQILFCNNCTATLVCVSSGVSNGAWVALSTAALASQQCK